MEIKTLYKYLNNKMPNIKFEYDGNRKIPCINGCMKDLEKDISFNVLIDKRGDNTFSIQYYFGFIQMDNNTLFLINEFNKESAMSFKGALFYNDKNYDDAEFSVITVFDSITPEDAFHEFLKRTNYLLDQLNILMPLLIECSKHKLNRVEALN